MLKRIIYLIIFISFLIHPVFIKAEEAYYPHPIIFVHGINSNPSTWLTTRTQFWKYFYDKNECKYFSIPYPYLGLANYEDQNNGDIPSIALTTLKNEIDNAIKGLPKDQKKVIIVAHSMGGLVTRALLGLLSDYQKYVDRVIFIGTPHSGSPYASAVWLLNDIRNKIVYPALADYSSFYSMNVGSHFRFSDASSFLIVSGLSLQIYDDLQAKLQKEAQRLDKALSYAEEKGPYPDGIALEQLRLNQSVIFRKTIGSSRKGKKDEIILYGQVFGNKTFLGQVSYLYIPNNFKVIRGDNPFDFWPISAVITWGGDDIYLLYKDNFTFPTNMSLYDARTTGDGIVPQVSQEEIGSADYTVNTFHTEETKYWQPILQAIDDMPKIESIRVIAKDATQNNYATTSPFYVIFKIKEYLLADVEVLSLKLDGTNVFPGDGYNPTYGEDYQLTEPYKPYDTYPEKGFLKERDDPIATVTDINGNETPLHLYPGEFYITVNLTYGKHEIKIKLKNPADKQTDELTYYISMPKIYNLYNTTTYFILNKENGTRYPEEVKYGYINVPPFQPTPNPDDAWIDTKTKISFSIADELFNQFNVNVWIYDRYGQTLIRKLITDYPVTLSGSEGNYQGDFQTFCIWNGKDENGLDVPDQSYYKVKIIAIPVDDSYILPQLNDFKQCLIATSGDYPNQDLVYADPSFVQVSREPQDIGLISENEKSFYEDKLYASARPNTIIDVTDLSKEDLTCKIQVPFPNSLVRADVPVFGLAYGKDFKGYKLEYGEGLNPTTWKEIVTSTKPQVDTRLIKEVTSAGATIRGNLGTWDTGLTEYEHNNKKHKVDLNGTYTLKLTVTDTNGNIKEDRVTVQVGRAISFAFGGKATSPDGKAELIIPEYSIKDSFELMGISEVNDTSIKERPDLNSNAYKIVPEEYFTEPATLKIKLADDYKGSVSDLKICAFDMTKDEHFLLPTEVDFKNNTIYADVTYLSSGYCYAAVEAKDESALIYPAKKAQPDYIYTLIEEPFDMKQQPIVTFNYRCDPDAKVNLIAKVGNRYYDIQIKDDPKTYLKNNLKNAGKIDGFVADGKTHKIEINLYALLSRFTSATTVEQLMLADLDASGYMDLHPGISNLKESVSVDNLSFKKRGRANHLASRSKDPSWSIGIDDDDPAEFELENNADKDYWIGAPFDKFNRAITPAVPVSNIDFNLTKAQLRGDYLLILKAISTDASKKGYVRFNVLLNGKPLETLQASHWAGDLFQIPIRDGLRKGKNTLTLQWLDGGSWVTWDYIAFQQL